MFVIRLIDFESRYFPSVLAFSLCDKIFSFKSFIHCEEKFDKVCVGHLVVSGHI